MQALTTGNIRGISEVFTADGNAVNSFGLSNMVWSFGQFIGTPHFHCMCNRWRNKLTIYILYPKY